MAISFRCQSCGNSYRVGDHLAGTVVTCTACNGPMNVPTEIEPEPAIEEAPTRATVSGPPPSRPPVRHVPTPAPPPTPPRKSYFDDPEPPPSDDDELVP